MILCARFRILIFANRPLATPNQLIIAVCRGYARRDLNLIPNTGDDAEGAWIAINKPELADDAAQSVALQFNQELEDVLRSFTESLREGLNAGFENEKRPPSMGAVLRHYAQNDDFLMEWSVRFMNGLLDWLYLGVSYSPC